MKNATYPRFTSLLCSVSLLTLFSPLFALAEEPRSQDLNSGGLTENQIPEGIQPDQGVIPKESKNNDINPHLILDPNIHPMNIFLYWLAFCSQKQHLQLEFLILNKYYLVHLHHRHIKNLIEGQ